MINIKKIVGDNCSRRNQLSQGIKIESEHKHTYNEMNKFLKKHGRMPSQKETFKLIAKDHLAEDKNYYNKLKKCRL